MKEFEPCGSLVRTRCERAPSRPGRQVDQGTIASYRAALCQRIKANGGRGDPELHSSAMAAAGAPWCGSPWNGLREQLAQGVLNRWYVHSPNRLALGAAASISTSHVAADGR